MPTRPCLGSTLHPQGHTLTTRKGSRCESCANHVEAERTRGKRARRPYTARERTRRAEAVAAHRAEHGDWCPGWQRPPHPSGDLTADHVVPVGAGGAEQGDLTVLCRSCNSRKKDQTHSE